MLEPSAISCWKLVFVVLGMMQAAKCDDIDFPDLVKLARSFELPAPPKTAPLVLANTGWTTLVGNSSNSRDPGIYRPAFLLEKLPEGKARVLMGWTEQVVTSNAQHLPATRPYSLEKQERKPLGYLLRINDMSSFVTAVQLARLGKTREAKALWLEIVNSKYFDEINALEGVGGWKSQPRILLARCLYQHFYEVTLDEEVNLKRVHQKLVQLKKEFPILFSDDPEKFYPHRKTRFVHDLGLTISTMSPAKGSAEALLTEWGNRQRILDHIRFFDDDSLESNRPAHKIFSMGIQAIPQLADLVDDRRLTRHISQAVMKKPEERVRLGELAKYLLDEMLGSQDLPAPSAIEKQEITEKAFFEKAAVSIKNGLIAGFHEVPLRILGQNYPKSLSSICNRLPADAATNLSLFVLAENVAESNLTKDEKTEALAGICSRLTAYGPKRAILQQLATVNNERTIELLRPLLRKLPADVDEPYWTCEAASFTHVLMQLENDQIWQEYLAVTKRASVGLRMEMMQPLNYSYVREKNRKRRLAFLASFLKDDSIRDKSDSSTKYEGPCAAFTFKVIEVRNFAAMKISSLLRLDEQPDEFWTAKHWEQLRKRVESRLQKETFPKW